MYDRRYAYCRMPCVLPINNNNLHNLLFYQSTQSTLLSSSIYYLSINYSFSFLSYKKKIQIVKKTTFVYANRMVQAPSTQKLCLIRLIYMKDKPLTLGFSIPYTQQRTAHGTHTQKLLSICRMLKAIHERIVFVLHSMWGVQTA